MENKTIYIEMTDEYKKMYEKYADKTLTDIDIWMARFAWEACRLFRANKLNLKEVEKIEKLLETYRQYVQDVDGQGLSMRGMRKVINEFIHGTKHVRQQRRVVDKISVPVFSFGTPDHIHDDDGLLQLQEEERKEVVISSEKLTNSQKKEIQNKVSEQFSSMPKSDEKDEIQKMLFERKKHKGNFKPQQKTFDDIFAMMEKNQDQNIEIMRECFASLESQKIVDSVSKMTMEVSEIHRMNKKMFSEMKELYNAQLQNTNLCDVPWYDLPQKIKFLFAQGFKRVMIGLISAPITVPAVIVKNIIIEPVKEAFEFFSKYIRIAWGTFIIFVVIGGVAHVYYTTDWTIVQNAIGSPLFQSYGHYIITPLKWAWQLVPNRDQYIEAYTKLGQAILGSVGGALYELVGEVNLYLKEGAKQIVYALINIIKDQISFKLW